METPKLDELANDIMCYDSYDKNMTEEYKADRIRLIENALLEIREILKTVRQRST